VSSPPWGVLGQKQYATTNTDTALTDEQIGDFSKWSAMAIPARGVMLLHMPVNMATEWSDLLSEYWTMKEVPVTFIKVSKFVKFNSLANGELSGNTDFFWIFTKKGSKGPNSKSTLCFDDVMKMKKLYSLKVKGVSELSQCGHILTNNKVLHGRTKKKLIMFVSGGQLRTC
jgi:hypothetical protein